MAARGSISSPFGVSLPTTDKFSVAVLKAVNQQPPRQFIFDSPLHTAVRIGNNALLKKLLSQPEWQQKVNIEGEYGETPLHVACANDNLEAVKHLLKHGAIPNQRRKCFHELHAIHLAASEGAENVLQYFLTDFATSHCVPPRVLAALEDAEGSTALHGAVQGRRSKCVELLIDAGAQIDKQQKTAFLSTPLHLAAYQGLLGVMDLMYTKRKDEYTRALPLHDDEGMTVLHRAAVMNSVTVLTFLLQHGCDAEMLDKEGRTAAMLASATESWGALKCLVHEFGANPFYLDAMGRTSVHAAAVFGTLPAQMGILTETFKENLLAHLDLPDKLGCTALHYAAAYGNDEAFFRLLEMGADWTLRTNYLRTVLHFAADRGASSLVQKIIKREGVGSIINDVDKDGLSALSFAATNGHDDVVDMLLANGALIFRESNGQTPLHNAAFQGSAETITTVLRYYPKILDCADVNGCTALHIAASKNKPAAVACLLQHGAAVLPNKKGRTPVDLSISEKNHAVTNAFIMDSRWREFLLTPSYVYGTVALGLTQHAPDIMKTVLDKCITAADSDSALDDDFHIIYDFSILEPPMPAEEMKLQPPKVLKVMSRYERVELITHPLTRALLERKWQTYGMYFHLLFTFIYVVFIALLTYMQISAVEYDLIPSLKMKAYQNVKKYAPAAANTSSWARFIDLSESEDKAGRPMHFADYACVFFICLVITTLVGKECMELYSKGYRYFLDTLNYLELTMCSCCIAYIATYIMRQMQSGQLIVAHDSRDVTFQIGSLTIFLAWFNLLRYCQPFGGIGIYAVMFFAVLKTLLTVALFFFLLTAAFTLTFFELMPMLLYPDNPGYYMVNKDDDLNPRNLLTPHYQLHTSALRIGAITVGDIDTVNNYILPLLKDQLPFPIMTFIILIVVFLMLPILLNNLLTGLAVGDITATMENASCLRLQCQIDLHLLLEHLMPNKYEAAFRRKLQNYNFYPNRRVPLFDLISRTLAGGSKKRVIVGTTDELDENTGGGDEKDELARMRAEIHKVNDNLERQQKLLATLSNNMAHVYANLPRQTSYHSTHEALTSPTEATPPLLRRRLKSIETEEHATRERFLLRGQLTADGQMEVDI